MRRVEGCYREVREGEMWGAGGGKFGEGRLEVELLLISRGKTTAADWRNIPVACRHAFCVVEPSRWG